jgi:hypothetical protein
MDRGEALISIWDKFEDLFHRKVDLLTESSIKNHYLRKSIDTTKVLNSNREESKISSCVTQAIELINQFVESAENYSDYSNDLKTQSAVERQLGIIGEAINKFDAIHPEIPS